MEFSVRITLNAHYTRLDVIRAIYEAIERLGLASWGRLRILEPADGIGHFLGAMPVTLATGAKRVAIEPNSITERRVGGGSVADRVSV